ncbi:hypothetical protein AYO39_02645 [Actinobacteria bacterium SCGC AG-212-D09]|nr:hypothetical protein AYO39_02645 [Actinobacteria bacterium SCGC AG-212-D09]
MSFALASAALLASGVSGVGAAGADPFIEGAKLVGSGSGGYSGQGGSVALSGDGDTALAGGPYDDATWAFVRTNGAWRQQGAKLVGAGEIGGAFQGASVALSSDGDTALIGGPTDNFPQGAAWVFTRAHGVWRQQGPKLVPPDVASDAAVGTSVALSSDGDTALIGGGGEAWVYTRTSGVWRQDSRPLPGGGGGQGSLALSGDGETALIGDSGDNNLVGATRVFTRTNDGWRQQGPKLVGSGVVGSAGQGWSVALSEGGSTAVIGGPYDNGHIGATWVFTRTNRIWRQQGTKLVGSGASGAAEQGWKLAVSGDGSTALIGGPADPSDHGAAWIFARTSGVWRQQGPKLVISGATGNAELGGDVALSADGITALIGQPDDNNRLGATWVFTQPHAVTEPSDKFTVSHIRTSVDGTIRFLLRVPGPGGIDVLETAWRDNLARTATLLQPAPRRFVFARAYRIASGAGTIRVTVGPNARGRLLVAHHSYPVTLRLWVTYTPLGGEHRSVGLYGLHLPSTCPDRDRDHDCDT